MKKILILLVGLAFFGSCTGPDGQSFLKYWWAGNLQYFSDNNPSAPAIIYNDEYFETEAGVFYLEYVAFDDSAYWMIYEITVDEGGFMTGGAEQYFQISLYSTGPKLYQWDEESRSLEAREVPEAGSEDSSRYLGATRGSSGMERGPVLGQDHRSYPFGTISIEYGELLP
jgi:hypothetical protein